ncbi:MAG: hypothetical protein ACK4K7_12885 [Allosphingosinicella sp.]|uniref:hypothetical protein n=1 Tax=Allosphingosinicella sp. TaxID=2823234 RepID=UPI0039619B3C
MSRFYKALLCAATLLVPGSLSAQAVWSSTTPSPAPAPQAQLLPGQQENVLRVGTPVALVMSEGLTTEGKQLRVGERFRMEVAEAVYLNGQVVIPAGSPAMGEVTSVRNKGMWGRSGAINARVLYVQVAGRQIRLSGQIDDKGVTGTAGVVGAIAVAPIVGFVVTGTSARIPVGSPVNAFLDEDIAVAFAPVAAQPLVVPAAPMQPQE